MPSRYFDGTYDGTFWLCGTEIPTKGAPSGALWLLRLGQVASQALVLM